MIAFVRTSSVATGKFGAAMAFAKEISAYIKSHFGTELTVLTPIGGNPWRIAWSVRYQDLAALQATTNKMMADKGFLELINKNADCFLAGATHDAIWQEV